MQIVVTPITEQSKTFYVFQNLFAGFARSITGLITLTGKRFKLCGLLSKDEGQYILVIYS